MPHLFVSPEVVLCELFLTFQSCLFHLKGTPGSRPVGATPTLPGTQCIYSHREGAARSPLGHTEQCNSYVDPHLLVYILNLHAQRRVECH